MAFLIPCVTLLLNAHTKKKRPSFQDSLITETLVSVITKAVITLDDGEQRLVAVKEGKAKKHLVLEPHDIIKELRLLSSLSHPAVRLHMSHPAT